jgi:hypothetical protein
MQNDVRYIHFFNFDVRVDILAVELNHKRVILDQPIKKANKKNLRCHL